MHVAFGCINCASAENVLKLVPDSALGLVLINQPAAVNAKLQELSRETQIPIPDLNAALKQQFNIRAGWDENGTIALISLPPQGAETIPALVLLVPVTDYDNFIEQFKPEKLTEQVAKIAFLNFQICARNIGGYAAFTDLSHQDVLEKTLKISKDVPADLDAWKKWLETNDVAGVILRPGIGHLSTIFQMTKPLLPLFRKNDITVDNLDLINKFLQVVEKELTSCGFGMQINNQDMVRINSRTLLVPGGKCAKIIDEKQLVSNKLLKGIPDDPFLAISAGSVLEVWNWGSMSILQNIKNQPESFDLKKEQADKMPILSPKKLGVRAITSVWKVGRNDDPLLSNVVFVTQVDDSYEFLAEYEKYVRLCAESMRTPWSPMSPSIDVEMRTPWNPMIPSIDVDKIYLGLDPALKITISLPNLMKSSQYIKTNMKEILGPDDNIVIWLVVADEHTIVTGHVNQILLRKTMDAIQNGKPGLADNVEVSKAALLLPPDTIFIAFLNLQGMADCFKRIAIKITPLEEKVKNAFPECPKTPLIGFAIAKAPNELNTCLVVPVEVIKAVNQYVAKFRSLRRNVSTTKP